MKHIDEIYKDWCGDQMWKFIRNLFKGRKQQCNLPVVCGSAWDLPEYG